MDAIIKVCGELDKKSVKLATKAVTSVMQTAYDTRASDEVTLAALGAIRAATSINNPSLNNISVNNDTSKKVVVQLPTDFGTEDDR